ncbi:MAG: hypothetical protein WKG01_29170, partial [Kofleriaceae bacterium]
MGIVVNLGLSRFCDSEPNRCVAILEALVKGGYSKRLREVVCDESLPAVRRFRTARIVEVTMKATTWLTDAHADPIRSALSVALKKHSDDSYSWDELECLGAQDIQDLAFHLDGPTKPLSFAKTKLTIYDDVSVSVTDLAKSQRNWRAGSVAYKLHELARAHRLI